MGSFKAWVIGAAVVLALGLAGKVAFTLYDQHQSIKRLEVAKQLAEHERDAAREANAANVATIERMSAQKALDDATVTALQLAVNKVRASGTHTREVIREAVRDDEATRAWADTDVPDGVRNALNTRH